MRSNKKSGLKNLVRENDRKTVLLFLLFFVIALVMEVSHRYHYRAELQFRLSGSEIGAIILIILIILNPKGIRILLLGIFLLLTALSTRDMLEFQYAGRALVFNHLFSGLSSLWIYFLHQLLYGFFVYRIIKMASRPNLLSKHRAVS